MMLTLLLAACSGTEAVPATPPITDAEASSAAATLLCEAAAQASQACSAEDGSATVGSHSVVFGATVESFLTLEPRRIGAGAAAQIVPGEAQLVMELVLSADGHELVRERLTHAASDTDLSKARAAVLDEALQRWMVSKGLAVLDALSGDASAPALASVGMAAPAAIHGGLQAWAGYPVVRGAGLDPSTGSKLGPALGSLLSGLGPFLEELDPDSLHTVEVQAKLGGGGAPGDCGIIPPVVMGPGVSVSIVPLEGQVLVDGKGRLSICELSESVTWPLPQKGASLEWEQFVVVGAAPAAEAAE